MGASGGAYKYFLAYSPLSFASATLENAFLDCQMSVFLAINKSYDYLNLLIQGVIYHLPQA
jgi:hypothetical protein